MVVDIYHIIHSDTLGSFLCIVQRILSQVRVSVFFLIRNLTSHSTRTSSWLSHSIDCTGIRRPSRTICRYICQTSSLANFGDFEFGINWLSADTKTCPNPSSELGCEKSEQEMDSDFYFHVFC
ncbi:unnamed protein product [Laminaria digitata]